MITYGQVSDRGRIRKSNEDAVYSQVISGGGAFSHPDIGLFIVVDGMGGEPNGRLAAEMAINAIAKQLNRLIILGLIDNHIVPADDFIEQTLRSVFEETNRVISGQFGGAGATATLALMIDNQTHIAHIGNTAAFLLSHSQIKQLTKFHDIAQGLVDAGLYASREEVFEKNAVDLNHVISVFGMGQELWKIDSPSRILPEQSALLLCSDWLYIALSESEILTIIKESYYPQDACQRIVDAVNAKGGQDNVSVILVSNQFPFKESDSK
jgi:PPM family protein phosphatase